MTLLQFPSTSSRTSTTRPARQHVSVARRFLFLAALCLACGFPSVRFVGARFQAFSMPAEDPYGVLGIRTKDRNNLDAIKKAYREKAKSAHPDKNPDVDPSIANERFHRITAAWEYLSNPDQKRYYDEVQRHGGRKQQQHYHHQQQQHEWNVNPEWERQRKQRQQHYHQQQQQHGWNVNPEWERQRKQRQREEDRKHRELLQSVQEAQASMLKITSLEELIEHKIVDPDTWRFNKHFLCVFVANKNIEHVAQHEYLFPYPFGSKGRNDMDWTALIQTAKVRFNKPTTLTKAFGVPRGKLSRPYIVLVQQGVRFDDLKYDVFHPQKTHNAHQTLEAWILQRLHTRVTVINRHPAGGPKIKVFFDKNSHKNSRGKLKSAGVPIPPGKMLDIPARLSDRLVILDASTDEFIGYQGVLLQTSLDWSDEIVELVALDRILVTQPEQTIEIGHGWGTTRTCYDLSTGCTTWIHQHENSCGRYPTFGHAMCAKSCGVCLETTSSTLWNGLYYTLWHTPAHRVPRGLREFLQGLREASPFVEMVRHDFEHLWSVRRTVTVGFLVAGLLLGIQVVLLALMLVGGRRFATYGIATCLNVCIGSALIAVTLTQDPYFLDDLEHVVSMRMSAAIPCLVLGMLMGIVLAHHALGENSSSHNGKRRKTSMTTKSLTTTKASQPPLETKEKAD